MRGGRQTLASTRSDRPISAGSGNALFAIRIEVLELRVGSLADSHIGLAQVHVVLPSFEFVILFTASSHGYFLISTRIS